MTLTNPQKVWLVVETHSGPCHRAFATEALAEECAELLGAAWSLALEVECEPVRTSLDDLVPG